MSLCYYFGGNAYDQVSGAGLQNHPAVTLYTAAETAGFIPEAQAAFFCVRKSGVSYYAGAVPVNGDGTIPPSYFDTIPQEVWSNVRFYKNKTVYAVLRVSKKASVVVTSTSPQTLPGTVYPWGMYAIPDLYSGAPSGQASSGGGGSATSFVIHTFGPIYTVFATGATGGGGAAGFHTKNTQNRNTTRANISYTDAAADWVGKTLSLSLGAGGAARSKGTGGTSSSTSAVDAVPASAIATDGTNGQAPDAGTTTQFYANGVAKTYLQALPAIDPSNFSKTGGAKADITNDTAQSHSGKGGDGYVDTNMGAGVSTTAGALALAGGAPARYDTEVGGDKAGKGAGMKTKGYWPWETPSIDTKGDDGQDSTAGTAGSGSVTVYYWVPGTH